MLLINLYANSASMNGCRDLITISKANSDHENVDDEAETAIAPLLVSSETCSCSDNERQELHRRDDNDESI